MSAPNAKHVAGSSQSHDGGTTAARRIRRTPTRTYSGPAFSTARKEVQGVGRNTAAHYDPVTGRKRAK